MLHTRAGYAVQLRLVLVHSTPQNPHTVTHNVLYYLYFRLEPSGPEFAPLAVAVQTFCGLWALVVTSENPPSVGPG
jgi:hypothetical protein